MRPSAHRTRREPGIRRGAIIVLGVGAATLVFATLVAASLGVVALDRAFPPDLGRLTPSTVVLDRDGRPLHVALTRDGQWRLPVDLQRISPNYLRMLIAVEDKRFRWHCGIDPVAIARAAWQAVTHGRVVSGGSSLTMQLVRMLEPRSRTLRSKVVEALRALQVETRLSKDDILRAYLERAPMGGNLEGVRAGSLAWFGKEPAMLSDPEAALLIALPQAPTSTRPDRRALRAAAARDRVLRLALEAGVLDRAPLPATTAARVPTVRQPFPRLAPHVTARLAVEGAGVVRTTIDGGLQSSAEHLLKEVASGLPAPVNVAAVVADWRTGEILARVGSADVADAARGGMNDMTRAIRSPGSTLKPFVYGMAFDGLLAHPDSIVHDEPTRFDDYAPHDFDGGFVGDVSVRHALQASLNLPAVMVLRRVGPIVFADRFAGAGLPLSFGRARAAPSLPMVLGGVGISLERLATAYAALADGGAVKPLFERYPSPPHTGDAALMRRPAADAVVDILAAMPPPRGAAAQSGIAYKTGTSYRFRDGWAVGFDAQRVVAVWMGRPDGATCAPCIGANAAVTLFRMIRLVAPRPLAPRILTPMFAHAPPAALVRLDQGSERANGGPRIGYPIAGSRVLVNASDPSVSMSADGGKRPYRWLVDGSSVESRPYARAARWRPASDGFSKVTVVDANGHSDQIEVRVIVSGDPRDR